MSTTPGSTYSESSDDILRSRDQKKNIKTLTTHEFSKFALVCYVIHDRFLDSPDRKLPEQIEMSTTPGSTRSES